MPYNILMYPIAKRGLATEFSQSEQPIEFARNLTNRFININGDAEKRQGLSQLGDTVSGAPTLNSLHEYIDKNGNTTLLAAANGTIYRLNASASAYGLVYASADPDERLLSVQFDDKLIFVNGVDRNFYTDDAGNSFKELQPIIEKGKTGSGTTSTVLTDPNVSNWISSTFVAVNDVVADYTNGGYGVVTSVGTSSLNTSPIGSAANGIGFVPNNMAPNDSYELWDTVELNIIPTPIGPDNVAVATSGTNSTQISVSGLDFSTTEIREEDFVYNTTRNTLTKVTSISANIAVVTASGQIPGDSLVFLKKAMPIATYPHVHFSRLYLIDARDETKVRISGPDDPQDFTTFQKTLSASTIDYGSKQPQAEKLLSLKTFQSFLVAAGQRNTFVDDGTNPIQDVASKSTDLKPTGLFNQGCLSRFAMESIGNDMIFVAPDGMRAFGYATSERALNTQNKSEVIKSEVRAALESKMNDPDSIQLAHYPRRNWLMMKIGDVIYNFNYTPTFSEGLILNEGGSWSKFIGRLAEQLVYFVRANGDIICAGAGGKVYNIDKGSYGDDGDTIATAYKTAWLTLEEPQRTNRVKNGVYIRPTFETGVPISYTINAEGDFSIDSTDSVTVTSQGTGMIGMAVIGDSPIGAQGIFDDKVPLRWRGNQVRLTFQTDSTKGPDVMTRFSLYGNIFGQD